jgi:hypothetical protein
VPLSDKPEYVALNQEDYIKDRVDGQIEWYDRKSGMNQRWFRWLRIVEIILDSAVENITATDRRWSVATGAVLE